LGQNFMKKAKLQNNNETFDPITKSFPKISPI